MTDEERLRQLQLEKLEREDSMRGFMRVVAAVIFIGMVVFLILGGR